MELERKIPCVRCGTRKLTLQEAETALEHASAFIDLVVSLDVERFGIAAREWQEKYHKTKKV